MSSRQTLYPGRQMGRLGDRSGAYGYRALGAPFLNSIYPDSRVPGAAYASTDIYSYNAQRVNLDYLGNAYLLPKHYLAPEGISYFQNLFAADGVDWTDASSWTEATASISQYSATEMDVSGLTTSSNVYVELPVFSGESVTGRKASAVANVKAKSAADVGKSIRFSVVREAGGTLVFDAITITLTDEYQPISTDAITGVTSNTGFALRVYGGNPGPASGVRIQYPGIIEWRTGQDTSKPPMPEDIKCFVPVGPELYTTANAAAIGSAEANATTGWTEINTPPTFQSSASAANGSDYGLELECAGAGTTGAFIDLSSLLTTGADYVVSLDHRHVTGATGEDYHIEFASDAILNTDRTVIYKDAISTDWATTTYAFTYGTTFRYFGVREGNASNDAHAYFDNLSIRESANGFYASEYTPANTVSSGVITRGTGTLLHPWHWERIGYSVPLKVKDQYDPWTADTAMSQNGKISRRIPTTKNGYYYKATSVAGDAKTDPSTEPTWPTTIGATVVDDQVTWTCAGYYTNIGAPIEPATTQDMATAAVLATGGSASTYPTSWSEAADTGGIASVVGEGVSPIHPDARYIDVRCNNSTGSNKTVQLQFNSTPITGVSQGDAVTVSLHAQLVSGTLAGTIALGTVEYNILDSALTTVFTGSIAPNSTMQRFHRSLTITQATAAKYNPRMRLLNIPDGTDFTIRITLPNSVQDDKLTSVILGQETRTSQVGALKYDDANWLNANCQIRCDFSMGVAQSAIAAAHNVWTLRSGDSTKGMFFQSDGDLAVNDNSNIILVTDWSEVADKVIRTAYNASSAANAMRLDVYSPNVSGNDSDTYAAAIAANGNLIVSGVSLAYPMHIHGLWSIPNGYESSVTLTSDSARYE